VIGSFLAIDHVQLAMPAGEEETARKFYSDVLGRKFLNHRNWPSAAAAGLKAGACRFIWESKTPSGLSKKAHPALRCGDYDGLVSKLRASGIRVDEPNDIPCVRRCHIYDPFGNRMELIAGC